MRHKSICPVCGKLAYLHGKTVGEDTTLYWICDECDKPFEIRFIDGTEEQT